ncbi:DUF4405 domain-containing protein [Ketobacter sp.]|uniref:DUF4405 domain-containing protein n=1 Tax=Ketobacter sp. TaxID=2083498 RepID=UPI00294FF170|nr:DUF4405 domain-containing protein [Ketobacter sp.]
MASSGVMMFYHLGEDLVKTMHEWMGLLFVGAIVLHLLNHWAPFSRYFKSKQAVAIVILVFAVAGTWMVSSSVGGGSEHPAKQLMKQVQQAPLTRVAALQGESEQDLVQRLQAAGVQVESAQQTLTELARTNQKHPTELLSLVLGNP